MRRRVPIFIAFWLFLASAAGAADLDPELTADGQTFYSANRALTVVLDFRKQRIVQMGHYTPMDVDYMERGDFHPIGDDQCLWVLKRVVAVPLSWQQGSTAARGVGAETPVLMLFSHGRRVYAINYGQLGFKNLATRTGKDGELINAWYHSVPVATPERVVIDDLRSAKAPGAAVEIRLLTGAIKRLPPNARVASR